MQTAQTLIISCAILLLILFGFAELALAWSVAWWLYLCVGVTFTLGLVRPVPLSRQWRRIAILLVALTASAALYLIPWTTRKPFLRKLDRIKPGMAEAEVRQMMHGYMEGTGWPAGLAGGGTLTDLGTGATHTMGRTAAGEMSLQNSVVFRHSDDGRFNSDWGIVEFQDGRVVGVRFSPD